jgi:hypothetical protein
VHLNGTYRYVLIQEDADEAGDTDTGFPNVTTITLGPLGANAPPLASAVRWAVELRQVVDL